MNFFLTVAVMYAVYVFGSGAMIFCVQRKDRFPAIMIASAFPFILVFAVFAVAGEKNVVRPCPNGLEEAEALVERKRQLMFDSAPIEPTIAKVWRRRYAMSVELQARRMRTISLELKAHFATI